jgi:limonene-1,2-epoxide hydrolase
MQRDEAVALFERRRDAWLREDADAYLALFADDVILQTPGREPVAGLEAYGRLVRASLAHVRPVSFDFHQLAVDGDVVLAEWTIALELRADRRPISYRGMSVCEIADGRIRTWREYYDPADLVPAG